MKTASVPTQVDGFTHDEAVCEMQTRLERRVPPQTFRRWRIAALIKRKPRFTLRDLTKMEFLARYLDEDRSMERAKAALLEALVNDPTQFPEEPEQNGTHARRTGFTQKTEGATYTASEHGYQNQSAAI